MFRPFSRLSSLTRSCGRGFVACATAVGATLALVRGRWRLFRRDVDGAVASLDVATRRAPESFSPWLHLARAHLKNRNWVGARRALARARDVAPDRFEARAVRALKHDGFEIAVLCDPVQATGASVPKGPIAIGPMAKGPVAIGPATNGPSDDGASGAEGAAGVRAERAAVHTRAHERSSAHPLGDCRDLDEYARFRSMPPITRAEIETVDWDAVADDLLDG